MKVSSTSTTSVLAAVERFGDSVAWYDEWAALIPILETMQMAECQRCRSFQADLDSQQAQHDADEVGWREVVANKTKLIAGLVDKVAEQDQQLATAQRQAQQQQQQLDTMREQLQAQHNERLRMDRGISFDLMNNQH